MCSFLASHGYGVYSLDFPGHKLGASGGELRGVDDCVDANDGAVAAFARERGDGGPICTFGHSMGGMTAIFTAALDPRDSRRRSRSRPDTDGRRRSNRCRRIGASGFPFLLRRGRGSAAPGSGRRSALCASAPFGRTAGALRCGGSDGMVSPSSVRELYDRAPEPKWLASVDSDHTYAGEHARAVVLEWLNARRPRNP